MNHLTSAFLAISISTIAFSQIPTPPEPTQKEGAGVETASARVLQTFKVEDDGFQSICYQVVYRGQHVIVQDVLCHTDYSVGDKIYFLVLRHDMSKTHADGKKLISFMVR